MTKHLTSKSLPLVLLYRFGLALLALLLTQLLFRLCFTRIFQLEQGEWLGILWGNIRFGCATVAAFMLPYVVMMLLPLPCRTSKGYRIAADCVYLLPLLPMLIANLVDCGYYQFTYRRMSYEIFGYLSIGGDMGNLIPHFLVDFWVVTLCGVLLIGLLLFFTFRLRWTPSKESYQGASMWLSSVATLALLFVLLRGGFRKEFIQLSDAALYGQIKNSALVINTPYSILRTLGQSDLKEVARMSDAEAEALYSPCFTSLANPEAGQPASPQSSSWWAPAGGVSANEGSGMLNRLLQHCGIPTRKNVVVIVLESFSQEYMGCYNNGVMDSYTPFLDSLAQHCLVYDGRSNGKKSIEGIPAIFASLPTLMEMPFIMSEYYDDSIVGLPAVLRDNGYHTAFFHGSYNGSMNFDKFCAKAGFDQYYGRTEYGDDRDWDHTWGIYDEPFLQYMAQTINGFPQPFMVGAFTISSHHPYSIPEQHKGEFKVGSHPLLQCVNYADYALSQFFHTCEKMPWFKNTIFVIMADHPGPGLHAEYNNHDGWYRIPFLIYNPEAPTGVRMPGIAQQCDLMPTLIEYLGIPGSYICFGKSLLSRQDEGWQVAYGNGYHQLLKEGRVAAREGEVTLGDEADVRLLDAIVQQYSHRLIHNELTVGSRPNDTQ